MRFHPKSRWCLQYFGLTEALRFNHNRRGGLAQAAAKDAQ